MTIGATNDLSNVITVVAGTDQQQQQHLDHDPLQEEFEQQGRGLADLLRLMIPLFQSGELTIPQEAMDLFR